MKTLVELVGKIEALKLDCLEMGQAGFSFVMTQLTTSSPELNIEGIDLFAQVIGI